MAKHANRRRRPTHVIIGGYALLSTKDLKLAPGLSHKLAAKFIGPLWVIAADSAVSFHLELPS